MEVVSWNARFASASELDLHAPFAFSKRSTSATAGIEAREFDPWRTGFLDGSGPVRRYTMARVIGLIQMFYGHLFLEFSSN